ncbi:MAG: dienelactone hydrolase family protein [Candidatus Limnocylindrales bacterium]
MSASTFAIAAVLIEHGYRVVMPALLDAAGLPRARGAGAAAMIRLCVSRELAALASGRTGAIVEWLRGLATAERDATAGRPVGVIGMCMSGGFALATIPFSPVSVAVLSQPALPVVLTPWRSDLGMSPADLAELRTRVGDGECVRVMRFSRDRISPRKRMRLLKRALPAADCVEIETSDPRLHSVLGRAADRTLTGRLGADVQRALDDTIAFLDRHLKPVA